MKKDSWKRPIEETPRVFRYPEQTELQLNHTREATPEEFEEWQEKELNWWADRQFKAIIIASFVQLSALLFMFSVMWFAGTIV